MGGAQDLTRLPTQDGWRKIRGVAETREEAESRVIIVDRRVLCAYKIGGKLEADSHLHGV